ncbi:MAG: response regulator [Acidobacteria bacterium]|nr:response regulator [Acidobacteriota bacterium]
MPHKLLLADDSVTIQRVIELTFADEDIDVLAVGDGKQAIDRTVSERPDIVLADVGMPERDGYEVAAFIKGHPELAHIPVLLLTGAFEPIDENRARAVGCDGILVKPFEPQMVINRVKDLLAGRRPATVWGSQSAAEWPPAPPPAPPADAQMRSASAAESAKAPSDSLEDYFDRLDAAFSTLKPGTPPPPVMTPEEQAPAPPVVREAYAPPPSSHAEMNDPGSWDPGLSGDPARAMPPPPPPDVPEPVRESPRAQVQPPAQPVRYAEPEPHHEAPPPPQPVRYAEPERRHEAPPPPQQVRYAEPERRHEVPPPSPVAPAAPQALPLPSLADAFAALLAAEQGQALAPSSVRAATLPDAAVDDIVNRVIARMTDQTVRSTVIDVAERLVREEIQRIKGQ